MSRAELINCGQEDGFWRAPNHHLYDSLWLFLSSGVLFGLCQKVLEWTSLTAKNHLLSANHKLINARLRPWGNGKKHLYLFEKVPRTEIPLYLPELIGITWRVYGALSIQNWHNFSHNFLLNFARRPGNAVGNDWSSGSNCIHTFCLIRNKCGNKRNCHPHKLEPLIPLFLRP